MPANPYGVAKSFATHMTRVYRETHGIFACNGIAYNHESPRRGENFVTRKICRAAAAIKAGRQKELLLGDTSAERDWGDARDTVRGMWLALQQDTAADYIFATGKLHTVKDIVDLAFATVDLNAADHIKRDERFMRPAEPSRLLGNPARAKEQAALREGLLQGLLEGLLKRKDKRIVDKSWSAMWKTLHQDEDGHIVLGDLQLIIFDKGLGERS